MDRTNRTILCCLIEPINFAIFVNVRVEPYISSLLRFAQNQQRYLTFGALERRELFQVMVWGVFASLCIFSYHCCWSKGFKLHITIC